MNVCRNNWLDELQEMVCKFNLDGIVRDKLPCDINGVKNVLESKDFEQWKMSRFDKPKLRYYNMYKLTLCPECYAKCQMSRKNRSLLTQYRAGILPLNVDLGRFRNVPLRERYCNVFVVLTLVLIMILKNCFYI